MDDYSQQQTPDIVPAKPVVQFVPVYIRPESSWRKRTSGKILITLLIVVFGLGAGWLAGKVLNHRRDDRAFPPDVSAPQQGENSSSPTQAQTESRHSNKNDAMTTNSAAPDSVAEPENAPPPVRREPGSKPPELKAIPAPAPPHVDTDKDKEKSDYVGSQASSETQATKDKGPIKDNSRKAMRKIFSESGAGVNSNDNRSEGSAKANDNKAPGAKKSQNENKNEGSPK